MLDIYNEYKSLCPNSPFKLGEISAAQMRQVIERQKSNMTFAQARLKPLPSKESVEQYENWKQGRKKNSLFELSEEYQAGVKEAIKQFEELFGKPDCYYIAGSYATGSWIDETTPPEEREIRNPHKKCKKVSDIDVVPEPCIGNLSVGIVDIGCAPNGRRFLIKDKDGFY
jgi:hypothetical protein